MATLLIRLLNASRVPLDDRVDVIVSAVGTGIELARKRDHDGSKSLRVSGLSANDPYLVQAFPMRHRPVGQSVVGLAGANAAEAELYCPADPRREKPSFPHYPALDPPPPGEQDNSALDRDPD